MTLWPRSLRARLVLWYSGVLTFTLAILGALALVLLDRTLRTTVDTSLEAMANAIERSAGSPTPFGPDLDRSLEALLGPALADRFFRLLDPLGRPDPRLAPRGRIQLPLTTEALRNAERGRPTFETLSLPGAAGGPVRLLTQPVVAGGRVVRVVQVALPLAATNLARSRFLFILLGLAPLALVAAALGGWFLARRALAPVDAMVDAARRIEADDLSQRLAAPATDDELGRLGAVLNEMLARLEASFRAVRQFSTDAAHELRTPLTVLKGEIEVALRATADGEGTTAPRDAADEYRRVLVSCLEEVDRLSALVDDMLLLARADSGVIALPRQPVDLSSLVVDAEPGLRALANAAGLTLTVATPAPAPVAGYAPLLFRVVFNLGENAIKYTAPGGTVTISTSTGAGGSELVVHDSGQGIPPEQQAHIFDRFYRGDPAHSRGGSGLGLAVVRAIVAAQGGQVAVDSAPDRGTAFRVTLPPMRTF